MSGTTLEQEWSPGPHGAGVGGAGACGGAAGVELRRTRLGHVQVRRGKAGANAGPAAGRGGVVARACRSRAPGGVAAQDDGMQGGGVQRMAVSPLGELKPRLGWCAGRPRVENVGGRRGEGSGWHDPNAGRPRPSWRQR
jgi:hypothetical protein